MAKPRSKDLAKEADAAMIASALYFTVVRFVGRDPGDRAPVTRSAIWQRTEWPDLMSARAERDRLVADEPDPYGRRPIIYAIAPGNMTVHVE